MASHPKQIALETTMRKLCDELDEFLEDNFGTIYPIHPNRMQRGTTASPSYDGLFSTGTRFSLGYGSKAGRGYLVDIEIRTLSTVQEEDKKKIRGAAFEKINDLIPSIFPNVKLKSSKKMAYSSWSAIFHLGTYRNKQSSKHRCLHKKVPPGFISTLALAVHEMNQMSPRPSGTGRSASSSERYRSARCKAWLPSGA